MKKIFILLLILYNQQAFCVEKTDSLKKKTFFWSLQSMGFGRATGFANKIGSINPENRIAKLNDYDGGIYFRPDFRLKLKGLDFWAKPRIHVDFPQNPYPRGQHVWNYEGYSTEFFFQELKSRWQINQQFFVQGGRYYKQIGTSIFVNPSNPFIVNTSRLNPKIELFPMDFLEVSFSSNSSWNYTLIANLGAANTPVFKEPFLKFERNYGLFIEHYGDANNEGVIFSADEVGRFRLGGYAQKNVSESVVMWTDFSADYRPNRFYPAIGSSTGLLNYEMVNGEENDKVFISGLIGASYTFNWGPTIQLEYFYHGKGYNQEQFDRLSTQINTAPNYNFDVTRQLSDLNLGRSINSGLPLNRQNYVFTQFGQNDLFDKLNINVRNLYSIDDSVNQLSALVEYNVADNLEIYGLALKSTSPKSIDYTQLINYQLMIGLISKF
ncbi:hypothetical protein VB796_17605 [Arcicella sp. LKC2W]|uniref:hypothetical protein n=1 Tax=Arcicella sp. LKC2W TaxID=2984198 RepID=UPI002B1ECCDE|nr:hypothetical protein [Arcicella sp. LKC2W]MEA5460880.1 hypothetical protein [Arcicella sp. LKC2W]